MKNKKIIIAVVVVVLLTVAGVFFKLYLDKKNTIEYFSQLQNSAELKGDVSTIWMNMHPEDKVRWTEQEYISTFNDRAGTYTSITTKSIKTLPEWTHPISGKVYSNVLEVTDTYVPTGSDKPSDVATHYIKVGGKWYFFSTLLSKSDKERIKSEVSQGPAYKELSKNADKYTGQKVVYSGKVIQVSENEKGIGFLRLNVGTEFSDDVIYVSYTDKTDVLQGDTATVYGILGGSLTYVSQANYNISVPYLEAVAIEKDRS